MSQEDIKELRVDVKEMRKDLSEIKSTLSANTVILDAHMHRTEVNEGRVERLEKWLLGLLTAILVAAIVDGVIRAIF